MVHLNQKEKWIAFNSDPQGNIIINPLEIERLVEKQQILLPAGIHQITGQFEKGAVIRIIDADDTEIGLGIVHFSTQQLLNLSEEEPTIANNSSFVLDIDHFECHFDVSNTVLE